MLESSGGTQAGTAWGTKNGRGFWDGKEGDFEAGGGSLWRAGKTMG